MEKVVSRKGISIVSLVITIIVLIVLSGAVIMTGVNVPNNAQLAVFKSNVTTVQEAVTMKMLNNRLEYINSENAKWIGVASGYTEANIENAPVFNRQVNGVNVVALDASLKSSIVISDEEFAKYYVDENGIVYHEGYTANGVTWYNVNTNSIDVASVVIKSMPSKTTAYSGGEVNAEGMVVEVTYSDGSKQEVTSGMTFTPNLKEATLGKEIGDSVEITVSYGGKPAEEKIEVEIVNAIFGIKRALGETNTSSSWERIGDSVGLEANATLNGTLSGENDFDRLAPWSEIKSYNYNTTTNSITAWYGEEGYKADGSNGDVLTYVPEFWYKRVQDSEYEYIYISQEDPQDSTFTKSEEFSIARYETYVADGKAYSRSGVIPTVETSLNSFRTTTTSTDESYCLMDYRYFTMQMLYLVEYADYNSQAKLGNGYTGLRYASTTVDGTNVPTDKALVAENDTNRIVITNAQANYYIVGQQISIGSTTISSNDVAANRTITAKEAYNDGTVTGTAIYFDGLAVDIAVGNNIHNSAQKTGSTDSLGMKSGTPGVEKTTGVIYRGVENIFGNTWTWVDGINIKSNEVFVCYDPAKYVSSTFTGDYVSVGTMPSSEGYQKTVGYNANHPLITYPLATGGSSTTYVTDYYYTNSGADRALRVGGSWDYTAAAGLWYWAADIAPSGTRINIGARLLKYQ